MTSDAINEKALGLRSRLQTAALELFSEQGYDRTTAEQIAARVGVTRRTFFRQFPDKREVLFGGEAILRAALTSSIAEAPDGLAPFDMLYRAFQSTVGLLEANRAFSVPRQRIVSRTPDLAERETAKHAALAKSLAGALKDRGVKEIHADLASQAGMIAYVRATIDWIDDPVIPLDLRLEQVFGELNTLLNRPLSGKGS